MISSKAKKTYRTHNKNRPDLIKNMEEQEFEGIVDSLIPRYKKITIILTGITDEEYAQLLSVGKVKITIID